MAYPLSQSDGKMKTKDWKKVPSFPVPGPQDQEEIHWVNPDRFFDQLPEVLSKVPPLAGEEAIYAMFRSLPDAASKEPAVKQTLKETAASSEKELITPLFQWKLNGPPAGNGWYSPVNNGTFGADYVIRAATAKRNMDQNKFSESKYIFTDTDSSGKQLNGSSSYSVTFPAGRFRRTERLAVLACLLSCELDAESMLADFPRACLETTSAKNYSTPKSTQMNVSMAPA